MPAERSTQTNPQTGSRLALLEYHSINPARNSAVMRSSEVISAAADHPRYTGARRVCYTVWRGGFSFPSQFRCSRPPVVSAVGLSVSPGVSWCTVAERGRKKAPQGVLGGLSRMTIQDSQRLRLKRLVLV